MTASKRLSGIGQTAIGPKIAIHKLAALTSAHLYAI